MKKVYIAGFDVFKKDAVAIGQRYKKLCATYGFEGLYPFDNEVDLQAPKREIACAIYKANVEMIERCDIVVANLNPFRGKESDSGTVWECGYALGKGKKVYGYLDSLKPYKKRFDNVVEEAGGLYDHEGMVIEDFEYPLNLMLACSIELVEGGFEDVLRVMRDKI